MKHLKERLKFANDNFDKDQIFQKVSYSQRMLNLHYFN